MHRSGHDPDRQRLRGRRPAEAGASSRRAYAAAHNCARIRLGRAAEARAGAALLFNQPFGPASQPDRYAHFVNEAHPGPAAPFGWTQSQAAEDELVSQLGRRKNRQALDEVDDWFTRALACA